MSSWFSSKKAPVQNVPPQPQIKLDYLQMQLLKVKEYSIVARDKKINEGLSAEASLKTMLLNQTRNPKDEEVKMLQIVRMLNEIDAYNEIITQVQYLQPLIGQIVSSQGDISKVQQLLPFLATLCYLIENVANPRGMEELDQKINEYYRCKIADQYKICVNQQALTFFQIQNINSERVRNYAKQFSEKYGITDVPGLPHQAAQQHNQQYVQYQQQQQQYQQYQQQYAQQYAQQQQYQQYAQQQSLHGSKFPANNVYQNNPNQYQPQMQPPTVYPQFNGSRQSVNIQQPNINFQQPKNDSNFNYPKPSAIIPFSQPKQDPININQQQPPFVDLNKVPQNQVDPFAALSQQQHGTFVDLKPAQQASVSPTKPQQPSIPQQPQQPQQQQAYNASLSGMFGPPAGEFVPLKMPGQSQSPQKPPSQASFGDQNQQPSATFNSKMSDSVTNNVPQGQDNLGNPMERTGLLKTLVIQQIVAPPPLDHNVRALEILQSFCTKNHSVQVGEARTQMTLMIKNI